MTWKTPAAAVNGGILETIDSGAHILIGGVTGSGKSVFLDNVLQILTAYAPTEKQIVLIDPKKVELRRYKELPHVVGYYADGMTAVKALKAAEMLIRARYDEMTRTGARRWTGGALYIVIDELADVVALGGKEYLRAMYTIMSIGRAAGVHVIACTQRATRDVIGSGMIKDNFDIRVCLRVNSGQASRNIIGTSDGAFLPRYGSALALTPDGLQRIQFMPVPEAETAERVEFWTRQARSYRRPFRQLFQFDR